MARWIALIGLVVAFLVAQQWMSETPTTRKVVDAVKLPAAKPPVYGATRVPGRVVELDTTKGRIDIVLFEKDCPVTTRRIADVVACGAYSGVPFPRVEEPLIQTHGAKARMRGVIVELTKELKHIPGAVGMARAQAYDSAANSFYILKGALPELDGEYTVFGHVLRGMDVVAKITPEDAIRTASLRPHNREDVEILARAGLTPIKRAPRPLDPEFTAEPEQEHEHEAGCPCGGH